jgi:hypothetical protein
VLRGIKLSLIESDCLYEVSLNPDTESLTAYKVPAKDNGALAVALTDTVPLPRSQGPVAIEVPSQVVPEQIAGEKVVGPFEDEALAGANSVFGEPGHQLRRCYRERGASVPVGSDIF